MNIWTHYCLNGGWTGKRFSSLGCNICRLSRSRKGQNGQVIQAVEKRRRRLEEAVNKQINHGK